MFGAGNALAATRYVWQQSPGSAPPYTTWATAATNIQDAVDAAAPGDQVLVTNGVYGTGGRAVVGTMTNRVAIDRAITVESVNGPQFTVIQGWQVPGFIGGDGAIRCAYLTNGASLSGFTLTNGATRRDGDNRELSGGGVWCESATAVVSNCTLIGNWAYFGGGANGGTLNNCMLTANEAVYDGGAADGGFRGVTLNNCTLSGNSTGLGYGGGVNAGTLNNCTLTGNESSTGGGAAFCTLNNCIVYFNTDNYWGGTLNYCCTTPLPPSGIGNITSAPLFVNSGGGNLRLQSNSPCINAGFNAYAPGLTDSDGNPRIVGGTVDIGAYEFQSPGSVLSYAWAQQYSLPTDGSADYADADVDGHNNWQEWKAWTIPTNQFSVLKLLTPQPAANGMLLTWQSVLGQTYGLERAATAGGPFSLLQSNLVGQAGTTSFTDTNTAGLGASLYRVGVPQ
jgi:hypothetical protein